MHARFEPLPELGDVSQLRHNFEQFQSEQFPPVEPS
jgi:hypothetical protein